MSIKLLFFLIILLKYNIFAQMEIINKIDFDDEVYDVKINGGYGYIYGKNWIYILDLTKDNAMPKKIICLESNEIGGKILLQKNYLALNYTNNEIHYISLYDMTNMVNPQQIFIDELAPSNFSKEREFERFQENNFFLDEYILHYYSSSGLKAYNIVSKQFCPSECSKPWGYLRFGQDKIRISRISVLYKILNCQNCEYEVLYFIVGPMVLDIMPDLNGLMVKYKDKAIGGKIGLWEDPPGVATQNIGFKVFDTSRVSEGYLVLENYFDYQWMFLAQYGWAVDGEKQIYDIQDMVLKNDYIYISSYSTCSVVSCNVSQPWEIPGYIPGTEFTIFENEENCYCFNSEECYHFNHPFGIAGANNKLYVANKRNLYILKLKKDDEEYPSGQVTYFEKRKNNLRISGWAEDKEGIKSIIARIGNWQFFSNEGKGRHKRPFETKYTWSIEIDLNLIEKGHHTLIVLVEDEDGDFSIINGRIPSVVMRIFSPPTFIL